MLKCYYYCGCVEAKTKSNLTLKTPKNKTQKEKKIDDDNGG